jgi:hypothetical protein
MTIGWILSEGYLVLTLLCATLVYASWRRRLQIRDLWGALLLGAVWFLILPIMAIDRIKKRQLPMKPPMKRKGRP